MNRAVVLDEQQAKAIREWLNAHNKSLIADVTLMMQAAVLRVVDGAIMSSAEREDQVHPDRNLHNSKISSTKSTCWHL